MKRFWAAMGFLTVLPLPAVFRPTEEDLARSVPFFPLVGLLIGLSSAGAAVVLEGIFPSLVLSVITADGFFSCRDRNRILEIMRDSRIGAFGCMTIGGVLAVKAAALASLPAEHRVKAALLAPLMARCVMVPMLGLLPPARRDGLGRMFGKNRSVRESVYAMAFLMTAAWVTARFAGARFAGLIAGFAVITVTAAFVYLCMRRIGGITGDTVGAASEINEMAALLVLSGQPISGLWG